MFVEDKPADRVASLCATRILAMDASIQVPDTAAADTQVNARKKEHRGGHRRQIFSGVAAR